MPKQYNLQLPKELPWQQQIRLHPSRHKLAICGRRIGKTTGFCELILLGNAQQPGAITQPGIYWWVAPNFAQAVTATRFLKRFLGKFARYRSHSKTFYLRNGSELSVKTANNEASLRGEGLDGCVVDEAREIKENVFYECVLPALSDKQGWLAVASTPNGVSGWLYDLYNDTKHNRDWHHVNLPAWVNPLNTPAEMESRKEILGDARFRQEYGAEFVAMLGSLFPPEWFTEVLVDSLPTVYDKSVIAVDLSLGRIKSDYQAVVFLGHAEHCFYSECRLFRTSIDNLLDEIGNMYNQYKPAGVVVESVGFQSLAADAFQRKYPNITVWQQLTGNIEKATRIQRLSGPLAQKRLKILSTPRGEQTYNQLRDFPVAEFDDGPDALEMAHRWMYEAA